MSKTTTRHRKTLERDVRRRLVLNAARDIYARNGVENTTMADIADAVGYTRRTLYTYFSSHDEILLLVLMDYQAARWRLQQSAVAVAPNGLARLRAWAETLYRFYIENPQCGRIEAYWDFHLIDPQRFGQDIFRRFRQQNDELAEGLRQIFRQGIEDGTMRADLDTDMCISQFLYTYRSILHRALSPGYSFASFPPDQYVEHYLDLFIRAIAPPIIN
jgi:AcrR family transcriptional regulator